MQKIKFYVPKSRPRPRMPREATPADGIYAAKDAEWVGGPLIDLLVHRFQHPMAPESRAFSARGGRWTEITGAGRPRARAALRRAPKVRPGSPPRQAAAAQPLARVGPLRAGPRRRVSAPGAAGDGGGTPSRRRRTSAHASFVVSVGKPLKKRVLPRAFHGKSKFVHGKFKI